MVMQGLFLIIYLLTLNELGFICNVYPSMSCWKYFSKFIVWAGQSNYYNYFNLYVIKGKNIHFKCNLYMNYKGHLQRCAPPKIGVCHLKRRAHGIL
ncbi:hypothetical protein PRUPE_2G225700 [Prunus persica]|uniref:S-protein homolog n=1 Tax=Prunus persica TaxID=3760 RepID=A0A251QN69_PRUPE|nr:hypothetical protein PRUPE_2G225700 [Prunus persica]